ncbi:hypothetical protein NVP1261O_08 [Vibrio phage 1.261.O._10N.286.51.A7]|uniref:Uncharacterized protein n=2 Tax=Mukerjeevirus TaxID=2733146 RepID=A0A2I7RRW5_9CAUD|nr:hypothetical protein HOU79_gp07 [Vibrio phage 1.224.A._10N.261.48.B1]YP_009817693.1 hypothetical protein HOU80_gp08 [Vibrio phage 1.261.O._10N.286.51.A7]AUR96374.1 hypothetical protein NVP1224A_07 [Vibrio phage 1.224.A._10N.261.48.B1]AUR99012.1 hypothetical protein NVP1261O_08 [Vibrio phage 1.261.O._10N.286.51.A7]
MDNPKFYVDEEVVDNEWGYYIRDSTSENEPVAAFLDLGMAMDCCETLNQIAIRNKATEGGWKCPRFFTIVLEPFSK